MSRQEAPGQPVVLTAPDGHTLAARWFAPAATAPGRPPVLIGSATAVKQSYYSRFAGFLAERGHPVLTLDYRGIGESLRGHPRMVDARMLDWGRQDLEAGLRWLRSRFPTGPLQFVGHSVAGQVLPAAESAETVTAALLVAGQSGAARHWRGRHRLRMLALWYGVIPLTTRLHGCLPGYVMGGESLPSGIAREWAHWGRHPDYILGRHPDLRTRFAGLRFPLRNYAIADDLYGPEAAVRELASWYGGSPSIRTVSPAELGVPAIGHFGFFRERFADSLWAEAAGWLADQSGAASVRTGTPAA